MKSSFSIAKILLFVAAVDFASLSCQAVAPTTLAKKASTSTTRTNVFELAAQIGNNEASSRRKLVVGTARSMAGMLLVTVTGNAHANTKTDALISDLETSLEKLKPVPSLLEKNDWDAVRTISKTPPVNQLWNLGDSKNTFQLLAKETDEFGLIDLKDENCP